MSNELFEIDPSMIEENGALTIKTNCWGSMDMLELKDVLEAAIAQHGVRKVIQHLEAL